MKKRPAFTLIELLIVVAIIAILAVIIVLNLLTARDKANYAKVKDELKTMSDAAQLSYNDGLTTAVNNWTEMTSQTISYLKDSSSNNLITSVPIPPLGFGMGPSKDAYQFYLKSSTDFGFRSYDKKYGTDEFCGYLNGAQFIGDSDHGSGTNQKYSTCDGN
jgi:prepilin-type N-terminal cleavage/methylation domain-containing protein